LKDGFGVFVTEDKEEIIGFVVFRIIEKKIIF
jgi:hypothetical protein